MPDIAAYTLTCGTKGGKGIDDIGVDFAGVGLTGDDEGRSEAGFLGNELIDSFNLLVAAVEDLQERSLCPGRPLDAAEPQIIPSALEIPEVHEEILDPQAGSLADGGELSGLAMCIAKTCEVLMLLGERREFPNDLG